MTSKAAFAAAIGARADADAARRAAWFAMPAVGRRVMAAPPAVTTGATSAMSAPFFWAAVTGSGSNELQYSIMTGDRFTYLRGAPSPTATRSLAPSFDNLTVANGPTLGAGSEMISFTHTGQTFELVLGANSNGFLVRVDDEYVTATALATGASGTFFAKYDFGAVARRRIDVIGRISFDGINAGAGDSIDPVLVRGPSAIVVGDSFTQGDCDGWTTTFADRMGWDDVWASGVGGTGYLNTSGGTKPKWRDRIQHDVLRYGPDVVLFAGSVNDAQTDPAAVGAEAGLLYAQTRAALLDALLFAGMTASGGANRMTANHLAVKDALKAAALANGVTWLDILELPTTLVGSAANHGLVNANWGAGRAGADGIWVTGDPAVALIGMPPPGSTIELGAGATRERIHVKSYGQIAPGLWNILFDGALQYAHAAGETWVQVGGSYMTGSGKVGAATGFGNSDYLVSNDGTHPQPGILALTGCTALGEAFAMQMREAMRG